MLSACASTLLFVELLLHAIGAATMARPRRIQNIRLGIRRMVDLVLSRQYNGASKVV